MYLYYKASLAQSTSTHLHIYASTHNTATLQSLQLISIMELTALNLINVQTLLVSVPIVILSIVDFYFTGHALQTFDRYFPPGSYIWQNPGQPYTIPEGPGKKVLLRYDYSPENMALVSAALSILAGLFGIAGFWIAKKVRPHSSHRSLTSEADT